MWLNWSETEIWELDKGRREDLMTIWNAEEIGPKLILMVVDKQE